MYPGFIHRSKLKVTLLFLVLCLQLSLRAGEGMWLPLLLGALNETEMKSLGMKMSADDIYSVNHGSLKDAVLSFNGGCTGEVVSDQGLLFTNHHCGYGAIQDLSTIEHNYLKNGYWADNFNSEMPCPGLFVTFIISIEDVTQKIIGDIRPNMDAKTRQAIIDKNINKFKEGYARQYYQDILVKPFFEGNQYFLFVTETYTDIRFVGAPPESIGKFGSDTDNWVWPRHTGDFSVFRIYAGPDNKPAAYSPSNKPFKPRYFFPISLDGVAVGDFTMVYGFPGKTTEYLPSYAISQTINTIDPVRIDIRTISLNMMDKYMRKDEATHLAYAAKYAGLANSWKKWIGEVQGLKSKHAVEIKEQQEKDFMAHAAKVTDQENTYSQLLPSMKTLYELLDPVVKNRTILTEIIGGANIDLFKLTAYADRLVKAFKENGEPGFSETAGKLKSALHDFYSGYNPDLDKEVFDALFVYLGRSLQSNYLPDAVFENSGDQPRKMISAKEVFDESVFTSEQSFLDAINQGGDAFTAKIGNEKAYRIYLALKNELDANLSLKFNQLNDQLTAFQKTYMKAQMELYPEKKFWPDANGTLRVAYGQVEPYSPRDGVSYQAQTYLDGVMEKYVPGDYEFDVSPKLIALYQAKDYGPYGEHGKMPVCFIGTNHTTGGNSGSPAIDAYGNLIGINFDRVWEGTMSDLYYDPSICRNIMVDIRYVLFIIDKYAGATRLVEELKIVHPKAAGQEKKIKGKTRRKKAVPVMN